MLLIGLNTDPLLQGEELAAAFMGALFSVLHDTILDARRGCSKYEARKVFDYHWSVPDITRPTYSTRHDHFENVGIKLVLDDPLKSGGEL